MYLLLKSFTEFFGLKVSVAERKSFYWLLATSSQFFIYQWDCKFGTKNEAVRLAGKSFQN